MEHHELLVSYRDMSTIMLSTPTTLLGHNLMKQATRTSSSISKLALHLLHLSRYDCGGATWQNSNEQKEDRERQLRSWYFKKRVSVYCECGKQYHRHNSTMDGVFGEWQSRTEPRVVPLVVPGCVDQSKDFKMKIRPIKNVIKLKLIIWTNKNSLFMSPQTKPQWFPYEYYHPGGAHS